MINNNLDSVLADTGAKVSVCGVLQQNDLYEGEYQAIQELCSVSFMSNLILYFGMLSRRHAKTGLVRDIGQIAGYNNS